VFGIAVTSIATFEGYDAPPTAEGVSGPRRDRGDLRAHDPRARPRAHRVHAARPTTDTKDNGKNDDRSLVRRLRDRGFAALLVLALKVGNLGAERATQTYRVEVRFDNIGGLKVRGPVRSAGVLVGRVADIHFDNERYQASVTLALDKRYSFPKDSNASILTSGLLGETYVGLEPGGDDKKLADGDRITLTQSAMVLERLIGQFLFSKAQEEVKK
jgi:phospholipid/cholesterol/gamma-HCH transport system substrate-binding protein